MSIPSFSRVCVLAWTALEHFNDSDCVLLGFFQVLSAFWGEGWV